MPSTDKFTRFGITVAGLLAFREWDADLWQAIAETATRYGIPHDFIQRPEIRDAARRHGVDPADFGDEIPDVHFTGRLDADAANRVTRARHALHDAHLADVIEANEDALNEAQIELIDALEAYAGIRVR